ncbi:MAG TPA: tetratricopeptide repeat protein, partial [Pyrinomonadaceae bacterium]
VIAAALLFFLSTAPPETHASLESWTKVRSKNFLLVGNAGERELRQVATRLEQFREVFKRLLTVENLDSSVPTTVIVFRDDFAYRPFEPLYQGQPSEVAGFFQSSEDVNYITLSADQQHVRSADALAFHEYVHLLVKNNFGRAPLWFNEGLAEFYSTLEMARGQNRVELGEPIRSRQLTLGQHELLPLSKLFEVDDQSPFYNEPGKRDLFYAESWAFVHYLLNGRDGERRPQLLRYLNLLAAGEADDAAFRKAFQADPATLDAELRLYVQLSRYPSQTVTFAQPVEPEVALQSATLSEAEARFYLGDLLLHTNRSEASEAYFLEALKLDDKLAAAHAGLGLLRLRQNRFAEAARALARAVALDPQSYLAHYYYAEALSKEGAASDVSLEGYYTPDVLRLMRMELHRAIELAPNFIESYKLLAFIDLVVDEQLDEASALLKQAIRLAPRRQPELSFLLAQINLRQQDFQSARQLLTALLQTAESARLRVQAQSLLETVAVREELARQIKAAAASAALEETPPGEIQPCDAPQPGPQKKPLRFNGEQVCGMLVRVECDDANVLLVIETGARNLRLRSDALNRIRFVSYTSDVKGQMTCGARSPATPVLVTYRPGSSSRGDAVGAHAVDGEVLAVEFIPKEWNPPPPAAP